MENNFKTLILETRIDRQKGAVFIKMCDMFHSSYIIVKSSVCCLQMAWYGTDRVTTGEVACPGGHRAGSRIER